MAKRIQSLLIIIVLLMGVSSMARAGLYEKGGGLGTGARAMGMAGAYTSLAEGESSLWWNPAGMSAATLTRLGSSLGSVYDGRVRSLGIAAVVPMPKNLVSGFSWRHHFYPQANEINTDELMLAGSMPISKDKQLSLGIGMKILFGHMVELDNSFSGVGLDLGLLYKLKLTDQYQLNFGAHIQDVDTRIIWQDDQMEQIPQRLALGAGFSFDQSATVALDLEFIHSGQEETEETRIVRLGFEKWFGKALSIRAGYMVDNHQLSTFSFGTGFNISDLQIQYALLGEIINIGLSHRLSLSYGLPKFKMPVKKPKEEIYIPEIKPEVYEFELVALPEGFSPNGDGLADTVILQLDLIEGNRADIAGWQMIINDEQNATRRTFSGLGYPEQTEWDGADKTGQICADGYFTIIMTVVDVEGKTIGEVQTKVKIKTDLPAINVVLNTDKLVRIAGKLNKPLEINVDSQWEKNDQRWEIAIRSKNGRLVKRYTGNSLLAEPIIWDGLKKGVAVADGNYKVSINITDPTGIRKDAEAPFTITSIVPKLSFTVSPRLIRPGRKNKGHAFFRSSSTYVGNISNWRISIKDKISKKLVRTISGKGSLPSVISWDGRDNNYKLLQGGKYLEAQLRINYRGGGRAYSSTKILATDITVDTNVRALALHLTAITFETGSSVIPLDAYKQLNHAANTIKKYARDYRVHIKGHTDNEELPDQAIELAWERALKIKEYLNVSCEIPVNYLDTVGYGYQVPIAPDKTAAGRAKNRRVEIVLIIKNKPKK